MNPLLAPTIELRRRLETGEPLGDLADLAKLALKQLSTDVRIPLERRGEGIMCGTELWKHKGAEHCRTILMQRKSPIWYPESTIGQISASVFDYYGVTKAEKARLTLKSNPEGSFSEQTGPVENPEEGVV